jgi:hypothetical protein
MKKFYLCLTILLPIIVITFLLFLFIPSCYSYYLEKNHIECSMVDIIFESTLPRNSNTPLARLPQDILRVIARSDL